MTRIATLTVSDLRVIVEPRPGIDSLDGRATVYDGTLYQWGQRSGRVLGYSIADGRITVTYAPSE